MTNRLKKLRTQLVAGAMLISGAPMFAGPAMAAGYVGNADDLVQLSQLLAQANNGLDANDAPFFAAAFAPNAHYRESTHCYTGHAQLLAAVADEDARLSKPGQYRHSHMTTLGHVIFDDKNHAHAHETNLIIGSQGQTDPLKGGAGLFYTGFYNDTFERMPNGLWLITKRDETWKDPTTGMADEKYHEPVACAADATVVADAPVSSARPAGYQGTADDITKISQLIAKYANTLDGWDHEGYASVMTPTGHWNRCIVGHDMMVALGKTESDKLSYPGTVPHSHMTTLGKVVFDDKNHAHAHETNMLVGSQGFVVPLKMGAGVFYTGYYNDVFERQPDGSWLMSDRDETSGMNTATGMVDEKYHAPMPCTRKPPFLPQIAPPK